MDTITGIRAQLQAHKGQWPRICTSTGLKYDWLNKFSRGDIEEPGHSKIERLAAYFKGATTPPDAIDNMAADAPQDEAA